LDEVGAARKPILRWDPERQSSTPEPVKLEAKAVAKTFPAPVLPSAD
jgi:hypothetical protein